MAVPQLHWDDGQKDRACPAAPPNSPTVLLGSGGSVALAEEFAASLLSAFEEAFGDGQQEVWVDLPQHIC